MATDRRGTARQDCRLLRRLFCCTCIRPAEVPSSPTTQRAQGDENVWITVDDLGTVNPGFIPAEDEAPSKVQRPVSRSASLVWVCQRVWQKKKLTPLSSLPLQAGQSKLDEEGGAEAPLFGVGEGAGGSSTLLALPLINLIPPTPSDVIDDDQFFDINSEEDSMVHTSDSECADFVSSQALGDQDSTSDPGYKPWDSPSDLGHKLWNSPMEQGHKPLDRRLGWDPCPEVRSRDDEEEPRKSPPVVVATDDHSTSRDIFHRYLDKTKEQNKESANELANKLAKEPAKEQAKDLANELAKEPVNELEKQPGKELVKELAKEEAKEPVNKLAKEPEKELVKEVAKEEAKEPAKQNFLRRSFQVPPLPEYPRKRSFNTGINLLQFTEHNLDDLNNKDVQNHELLKARLQLLPLHTKMELRKPATRTCSLGNHVTRSYTYHSGTERSEETPEEEGSPRQRRITVASYVPHTSDRNENFTGEQHSREDHAKPLAELDTEEVCRWFFSIGLQKCLPFIRGASLCGSQIANIDPDTLELLHVSALEERELLLSEIYRELHPPDSTTRTLDTLLESIGPHNVDKFTAALVSMSKSKSSPHVNYVSSTRSSFMFRDKSRRSTIQRSSLLVEITINALEQIVHLRTPKDTSVGKVMDSCLKTLGVTDNKDNFSLRNKEGPLTELSFDQQIGDLLGTEKKMLELNLCKKEKRDIISPKLNASHGAPMHILPGNLQTKEEKIRELKQNVDSLQNMIHQVQELHQSLVSFCGELKNMESEPAPDSLSPTVLESQLGQVQRRLLEKQQRAQALQDGLSSLETRKNRRPEVHLLDKMKLDCQIFKEEISIIHLNRKMARLKSVLQNCHAKELPQMKKSCTLGQLVSPQCPAMLLMAHEQRGEQGGFGFTVRFTQDAGLVVVSAEDTQLCLNDRLVEVNGVSVLESGEQELSDLLCRQPSARIIALRKPPMLPPKPGRVPDPSPSK